MPSINAKQLLFWTAGKFQWHARLLVCTAIVLLAAHSCCAAVLQNITQEPGQRTNPAPWRPAFGTARPVAKSAPSATRNSILKQPATRQTQPAPATSQGALQTGGSAVSTSTTQSSTAQNQNANQDPQTRVASRVNQPGVTRVSRTLSKLPNDAGQIWREYDITPYTSQVKTTENPEKAILDWVLRETGTEMWFTPPMGMLNVDNKKLYVYHTPEIQAIVKRMVDRFVRTRGQVQAVDVNLVTVTNPNWRSQAYTMLQPIDVKSPGVEAWLVSKENAAILLGQLSRRTDFKQHSGGRLTNHDGQAFALDKTRPVQFVRNIRWTPGQFPNYQPLITTLNEGYKLQLSCLTTLDNAAIEATIKCDVDQVENLTDVRIDVPTPGGTQPMTLKIPQLVSWRLHERFRWPSDEVLVLSCGVVASPEPEARDRRTINLPGLKRTAKRADALLFIDYRGPATGATVPQAAQGTRAATTGGMTPFKR